MGTCYSEDQLTVIEKDKRNTSSTPLTIVSNGRLGAWDAAGMIEVMPWRATHKRWWDHWTGNLIQLLIVCLAITKVLYY